MQIPPVPTLSFTRSFPDILKTCKEYENVYNKMRQTLDNVKPQEAREMKRFADSFQQYNGMVKVCNKIEHQMEVCEKDIKRLVENVPTIGTYNLHPYVKAHYEGQGYIFQCDRDNDCSINLPK